MAITDREDGNRSTFSYATRNSFDAPLKDYTKGLIEAGLFNIPEDKGLSAFNYLSLEEDETGDTSPIVNFSNTRYAENVKIKDALKSLGRKKLAARRAFPICKVYLIEEDDIYNKEYIELDEIYTYSNIESIDITDSRKRPSSICRIVFMDPHGILSGLNQWNKAANPVFANDENPAIAKETKPSETRESENTNNFLRGTEYEQNDMAFVLNVGLKIKVKMGFSNDANKLEEVFLGEIKEVNLDNSANRIEVVAQGYGAELVAKTKGTTEEESEVGYKDTFDLLARLMFSEEVIHFGRRKFGEISMVGEDQSLEVNDITYKETFGQAGLINSRRAGSTVPALAAEAYGIRRSVGDVYDGISQFFTNLKREAASKLIMKPFTGPQDDNIFAPNFTTQEAYTTYDWARKWTGGSSWDGDYKRVATVRNSTALGVKNVSKEQLTTLYNTVLEKFPEFKEIQEPDYPGKYLSITGFIVSAILFVGAIALGGWFVGVTLLLLSLLSAYFGFWANTALWTPAQEEWRMQVLENAGYLSFDWIEAISTESVKYNLFYSSIWDVFEEMTLRHPGYVKHPRIYYGSNRMTMFFGLPDQNMWSNAGDPLLKYEANVIFEKIRAEADAYYNANVYWYKDTSDGDIYNADRRTAPSRIAEGAQNYINTNPIIAISRRSLLPENGGEGIGFLGRDDAFNVTAGQNLRTRQGRATTAEAREEQKAYLVRRQSLSRDFTINSDLLAVFLKSARRRFKPFRRWHNINSYTDIISNDIQATADGWYTEVQVQYTKTSGVLDAAGEASIKDPNSFIDWDAERIVTLKAHTGLQASNIRRVNFQFPNCKSKVMAKRYARAMLAKQAKDMYKGSILVMGAPYIRPYDICIVNDMYNKMYGPIEVEEVHHMFSADTGFVTQIYPDTLVVHEDMTPYVIFNSVNFSVHMRTEKYMLNTLEAHPVWGDVENYSSNGYTAVSQYADIYKKYTAGLERSQREFANIGDFASELAKAISEDTAVGVAKNSLIGLAALNAGGISSMAGGPVGFVLGGIAGGLFAAGLLNSDLPYFYASAKFNQFLMNYMTESKAYIMVPLLREGIPVLGGYNIQHASSFYKSPIGYMRQFLSDGAMGLSVAESDLALRHASIKERNGGEIGNWLASTELFAEKFESNIDKLYIAGGDRFIKPVIDGMEAKGLGSIEANYLTGNIISRITGL